MDSEIVAISKSSKLLEKKLRSSKTDSNIVLLVTKEVVKNLLHQKYMTILIDQKKFKSIDCRLEKNIFEEQLFGSEDNQVIKELGLLDEVNMGLYILRISLFSR